jgi:hypothetical protein
LLEERLKPELNKVPSQRYFIRGFDEKKQKKKKEQISNITYYNYEATRASI